MKSSIKIGRDNTNDLIINEPRVSRNHAIITILDNGEYEIIDLGSTNGTFVNGQKISRQIIYPGDKVQVASSIVEWKAAFNDTFVQKAATAPEKETFASINNPLTIARPNLNYAISTAVFSIIFSFASYFFDDSNRKVSIRITFIEYYLIIRLLFYFRKYLENFKATNAIMLTNWIIAITITSGLLVIILIALPDPVSYEQQQNYANLWLFLVVFIIVLLIASTVISIMQGIALQKIKNDFVGLLKELGMAIVFLSPAIMLIFIVGLVMEIKGIENKGIFIAGTVLEKIVTVIMIMIFARAQKFVKTT